MIAQSPYLRGGLLTHPASVRYKSASPPFIGEVTGVVTGDGTGDPPSGGGKVGEQGSERCGEAAGDTVSVC